MMENVISLGSAAWTRLTCHIGKKKDMCASLDSEGGDTWPGTGKEEMVMRWRRAWNPHQRWLEGPSHQLFLGFVSEDPLPF